MFHQKNVSKRSRSESPPPSAPSSSASAILPSSVNISKAICQFSSKQDVEPAFLESDTHVALMAGDGHGGDKTANTLSSHGLIILEHVLRNGLEAGMRFSQDLCKEYRDGAMLVLALYEISSRTLKILSVGDASCCVYQHEKLIHHQPHQRDLYPFLHTNLEGVRLRLQKMLSFLLKDLERVFRCTLL